MNFLDLEFSPVITELINKIVLQADFRRLTVQRFITGKKDVKITWAVFPGDEVQFVASLPEDALRIELDHREGATEFCQAARRLRRLLKMVSALQIPEPAPEPASPEDWSYENDSNNND